MNARGRDVLVQAALDGRPQTTGILYHKDEGHCALGILAAAAGPLWEGGERSPNMLVWGPAVVDLTALISLYGLEGWQECPACPGPGPGYSAIDLITHLNDYHRWDFLTIARKLGPEESTP